ncbi:hypothetical protein CDAR_302741 [Caerostris darwini]|uniref:Uncharacterized protein n=1 Tax=Caerostris darwini TaxID=1538125 RepID=A0AAV4V472_9ARAC|nr:hypothetical protein CDAR_302741 [Caerostris darwini]
MCDPGTPEQAEETTDVTVTRIDKQLPVINKINKKVSAPEPPEVRFSVEGPSLGRSELCSDFVGRGRKEKLGSRCHGDPRAGTSNPLQSISYHTRERERAGSGFRFLFA